MADYTTLARPYASAAYQMAVEGSALESWSDALANMAAVTSNADIVHLIDNPALSREQKGIIVAEMLEGKLEAKQKNLILLMAHNGRLKLLPEVAEQYEVRRAEAEGKVDAEVVSAYPLSDEQENLIIKTLKNKLGSDVTLTTSIDASLIGGVIIKAGDTIIDGSMKSQLDALATAMNR